VVYIALHLTVHEGEVTPYVQVRSDHDPTGAWSAGRMVTPEDGNLDNIRHATRVAREVLDFAEKLKR
jgi:hypothetical protein